MGNRKSGELSVGLVILFGLIACVLYGVGAGIRSDIGILLNPLAEHCGLRYEQVSFCIAVMQIVFGATQPLFGILAGKRSNREVLTLGSGLLMLSMIGMLLSHSFVMLLISLGFIFGAGAGALAFGLVLTSSIHFVGQKNAMLISGMLNAAAGMVGFVLSPLMQGVLNAGGLFATLMMLFGVAAALIPVAFVVTKRDPKRESPERQDLPPVNVLFRDAFRNRTYRLLLAGFSTCGFHMVIIESHLFSQFVSYGIEKTAASWAYSVYGIATILGALLSGYLSTRVRKGDLLGFYYGFRAVWVLLYLFLMPKNIFTAVVFSIGLGFTGDATVSPTSGLVNENFPLAQVASLIGLLFLVHQIGAFFSAWLGGVLLEVTGGYNAIWLIDVCLCTMASLFSLRIHRGPGREKTERI
jgi:predicted MFS family arabinose efflux permease